MINSRTKRGFTLIELLVVIVIIGLLAGIGIASFSGSLARGRDAKRRSDIKELSDAVKRYYVEKGAYPVTTTWYGVDSMHDNTHEQLSGPLGWIPDLAPEYVSQLPVDPRGLGTDTGYYYYSNGANYKILAFQTVESNCPVPESDTMYDPARNPATAWGPRVPCTYALYSAGARSW